MPPPFQWSLAIFDDDPTSRIVNAYTDLFRDTLKLKCEVYPTDPQKYLSFLRDEADWRALRRYHMCLVDMQWNSDQDEITPVRIPDLAKCMRDGLAYAGVRALGSILDDLPQDFLDERYLHKQAKIPYDVRGWWIAAALSHINPVARILFFTSHEKLVDDPASALEALLSFHNPRVHVFKKQDDIKKSIPRVNDNLTALQEMALETSPIAYSWFVGGVLLPKLIGFRPVQQTCGPILECDDPNVTWDLTAENFFPQWEDWETAGTTLQNLKRLRRLRNQPQRLSAPQRRALASVRHVLKPMLRSDIDSRDLDEAERTSWLIGSSGASLVSAIAQAKRTRSRTDVENALYLCYRIDSNSLVQLWDYCVEVRRRYGSDRSGYWCDPAVELRPNGRDDQSPVANPPLPVDMEHLRRSCDALISNASDDSSRTGNQPVISLAVHDRADALHISYTDNSLGFENLAVLADKLEESVRKKGLDRGLPLALAFGLFYPLLNMDIKLKRGQWVRIFPEYLELEGTCEEGFGLRWTFIYGSGDPWKTAL